MYNMKHCIACSSGTAAVHMAIGALQLAPGTEVITSAITDMGTLTGILYQNLIPVFADIDPFTFNMDPESVEKRITDRTGAIVVVHHAGLAADMDKLLELGKKHNIPLIEAGQLSLAAVLQPHLQTIRREHGSVDRRQFSPHYFLTPVANLFQAGGGTVNRREKTLGHCHPTEHY